ncbi:tetratricopeptide repeat protein [Flavobacterium amniphilum]|uniref:tetratricopeptide repeat protein n=1 Tax=Flavobacterium amniphilum TaxID=1834035 RepID=UPI00202A1DF8|nr:tetratricopeptide repeat protein [Flavobacterium amniphilum]MCL9806299.1 tetratricopeptide repeat protein [Flavobacterium amniphilum]
MKTYNLIFLFFVPFLLTGCAKTTGRITNREDYNHFLLSEVDKVKDFSQNEINFWQGKFDAAPNQISYLSKIAANYAVLFEQTGDINYLYKAEDLLLESNEALRYTEVGTIRALARNYITQHRFKEALELAQKAYKIGDGLKETQKLLFDVHMELGNYDEAEKTLKSLCNDNDFDCLIRVAKWNDHKGKLDTAISLMEKALEKAKASENTGLMLWTYSNLGDMYGHAGKIQQAYDHYLMALKINPNNSYALKGLAWIAFSHEKNTKEALRIINHISKKHNSPDFYLLKAEIAEYEMDERAKEASMKDYFKILEQNNYGVMYNKYNSLIYADDKTSAQKALEIAQEEINNRPTPDSYDLLAWAYYNLGDTKKAYEIVQKYVADKSFEPQLNYHVAAIYKANNLKNKIKPIKKELESSIFELGPNMADEIENL